MNNKLFIGTSGWSYKHWKDVFYPQKLSPGIWLSYYANFFNVSELNGCFYRLPTMQNILNWVENVPLGFLFCPKLSRFMTHNKKLHDPEQVLPNFFNVFDHMKSHMGPVLIQLPGMVSFNNKVADHFFQTLCTTYGEYEFALEFRHESWLQPEAVSLLEKHHIAMVISQSNGVFPYAEKITANNIYLRFHGPKKLYASAYSDEMLLQYASKIKSWLKQNFSVYAFFNNDIGGHAVTDALKLQEMISG